MQVILSTLVVAVVVGSAGTSAPAAVATEDSFSVSLGEAFTDRATVEAVVACFIDTSKCNAEQEKIRVRAVAAMQNMGRCPETLCTEQQQREMTQSMELLQKHHRDLWIKLLVSMFDLDLPTLASTTQ
ncbi:uncharacterized protein LOC126999304 [Eriocheir sinensis]|uniref:uncharacterized protein LOC126999304 n=1 Tax=Eriocheir sinensis TaxID=95602 RepID=UPI0021C6DB48|nr:uncharacterized protein LOC126999304 [Eriocheir sinensis]XP_050717700.1 uncharacterized protein LOC126999304 [Eriocheir sinensis]